MYNANNDEHIYVVTYKEFIFAMLIFILVLVALYPKDILKDQILSNNSNYALDIIYLKDLIKHHPNDPYLKYIYAEKNLKMGNIEEALQALGQISMVHDKKLHTQVVLLSYQAYKMLYFSIQDKKKKAQLHLRMQQLFHEIYTQRLYDADYDEWYREAVFVRNTHAAYHFLKKILKHNPNQPDLLEDAYYLSLQFKNQKDSQYFLNLLERYSQHQDRIFWAERKYAMLLQYKKYAEAEQLLKKYANDSLKLKKELARFYLQTQQYAKASQVYLDLYHNIHDDNYLKKAISVLIEGGLLHQATQLVHKYENHYIQNPRMRDFFLKVYLSAGELQRAANLSKRILKTEHGI